METWKLALAWGSPSIFFHTLVSSRCEEEAWKVGGGWMVKDYVVGALRYGWGATRWGRDSGEAHVRLRAECDSVPGFHTIHASSEAQWEGTVGPARPLALQFSRSLVRHSIPSGPSLR